MGLKDAYAEKMEPQLREWGAKLDELKAKADKAEASAKIEYHKQIDSLRSKQDATGAKLRELRAARDDAWEAIKQGVEGAWTEMKNAMDQAAAKFK